MKTVPEITLKYKRSGVPFEQIKDNKQAAEMLRGMFDDDTLDYLETFIVLYLGSNNVPIGFLKLSTGGLGQVTVDVRVILGAALKVELQA